MTGYFRQSSYGDGETILAAHTNTEYDRLVEVFNSSTGHTHDGSAGQGAYIRTLSDTDNDTRVHVEFSGDEDKVRMFVNGVERLILDANNFTIKKAGDESVVDISNTGTSFNVDGDFEINISDTHRIVFDQDEGSLRVSQYVDEVEEIIFIVDANGLVFRGPGDTVLAASEDLLQFSAENIAGNTAPIMSIQTSGVNFRFGEDFDKFITLNEYGLFIDGTPIGEVKPIGSGEIVNIGPSGDFYTINAAISSWSNRYRVYTKPLPRIVLQLMDDYVMAEQIIADGIDLSNFTITKQNQTGFTNVTRSALTDVIAIRNDPGTVSNQRPMFAAINGGKLPLLDSVRFDFTPTTGSLTQTYPVVLCRDAGSTASIVGTCRFSNTGQIAHATQNGIVTIIGTGTFSSENWLTVGAPSSFFTLLRSTNNGQLVIHNLNITADVTTSDNNLIYNNFGSVEIYSSALNGKLAWTYVSLSGKTIISGTNVFRSVGSTRPSLTFSGGSVGVIRSCVITEEGQPSSVGDSNILSGSVIRYDNVNGGQNVTPNQISTNGILFRTL